MRQLTLEAPGRVVWRDVPPPTLSGVQAAILRPIAVSVCDFDRSVIQGYAGRPLDQGYPEIPLPIALGHEIVAEVVEVGSAVRDIQIGARVVVPLHVNCGACGECRAERTNCCSSRPLLANYGIGPIGGEWGGGMSDLLLAPYADAMLMPLPPGASPVDCVAVGCNLVDTYRTIGTHLSAYETPSYLILGGKSVSMALYSVVVARALGVADIGFLSDDAEARAHAEALGARAFTPSDVGAKTYQIVHDNSGDPERTALGMKYLARGGVCTTSTPYGGDFSVPVGDMFLGNATWVIGQPHARASMGPVLDLIQAGKLSSTSIPHEVLPWDTAAENYGQGKWKTIFVRD